MADDNLILEQLRLIRAELDAHDEQVADIKRRLHGVEDQVAGLQDQISGLRGDLNQYVHRRDTLDERVRRGED